VLALSWLWLGSGWLDFVLALGWDGFGLALAWVGLALAWVGLGLGWLLAWVGLALCWVGFGLGWLWVGLALALVVLALGRVCFGLGWLWLWLGLCWLWLGLGWVSFVMDLLWLGLAWVGFGLALDVGNSSLSFNFLETNLMHLWVVGNFSISFALFKKNHYVCLGVLDCGEATPATASNFLKSTYALCYDFCHILI
jgi:hypothetical protein